MSTNFDIMHSDIVGRVSRYPLPPNEHNSLIPVFEAIHNSIHAIQDRYGDSASRNGKISIEILREEGEESAISGFIVTDNGIGLDEENYTAFKTPDSRRKIGKGGKGIGRLGWLKVFDDIKVRSGYAANMNHYYRNFDFVLDERAQIQNIVQGKAEGDLIDLGTAIHLNSFKSEFKARCPMKTERIAHKIIAHFLPVFASKSAPKIILIDAEGYNENLSALFEEQIVQEEEETVEIVLQNEDQDQGEIQEKYKLKIKHLKCTKLITPRNPKGNIKGYNWLYLCANERCVIDRKLDDPLGLKALDGEYIYIACVSGELLDRHVNQERTAFSFTEDVLKGVSSEIIRNIKVYLDDYIKEVKEQNKVAALDIIDQNPQFLFIKESIDDFVESKIPNNAKAEDIKLEMFRERMRRSNQFKHIKSDITNSELYTKEVEEKVDEYKEFLEEEQKGALAEYVLKRKQVLELLDTLRGYDEDSEQEKHYLENAVHSLICPLKSDSQDLHFEDHNLWIVDDRLAFFDYFQSDKKFEDFTDVDSAKRPDMSFFYNAGFAWRRTNDCNDTIVIVEFKRPGRDDYNKKGEDPPVQQIINYIEQFKSGKTIRDKKGKVISSIGSGTAFHGYIIADITPSLYASLRGMNFRETPDKSGMIGYLSNPEAFVEIISYEKLLNDAKLRNAVFFEKLGIV